MKQSLLIVITSLSMLLTSCGVSRQVREAKAFGNCKYLIQSADSVTLAGYDVRQFRKLNDINPIRYPRLAAGMLAKNLPINGRINLQVSNPSARKAAINQLEYKVLLVGQELFNGVINQRIEVAPDGGTTLVPVRINANAYQLFKDAKTRDALTQLVGNLAGADDAAPTRLTIKLRPVFEVGKSAKAFPGYITLEQEVTSKMLFGN